jgi:hypothetical protein
MVLGVKLKELWLTAMLIAVVEYLHDSSLALRNLFVAHIGLLS